MQQKENEEILSGELKKEFQLERMILFSDAVFAIVITLMAIEIRLPDHTGKITDDGLLESVLHLLPVIFAYFVSFVFIGVIWYQHLKMFGLLRNYDKGLVIHNLALLFFIGLFPFSATLITGAKGSMMAIFMYFGIILLCLSAQYFLYRYILVKRPSLRTNNGIEIHLAELQKKKVSLIGFVAATGLIAATYILIPDPNLKPMATLWMAFFPLVYKLFIKKKKKGAQ